MKFALQILSDYKIVTMKMAFILCQDYEVL